MSETRTLKKMLHGPPSMDNSGAIASGLRAWAEAIIRRCAEITREAAAGEKQAASFGLEAPSGSALEEAAATILREAGLDEEKHDGE